MSHHKYINFITLLPPIKGFRFVRYHMKYINYVTNTNIYIYIYLYINVLWISVCFDKIDIMNSNFIFRYYEQYNSFFVISNISIHLCDAR